MIWLFSAAENFKIPKYLAPRRINYYGVIMGWIVGKNSDKKLSVFKKMSS